MSDPTPPPGSPAAPPSDPQIPPLDPTAQALADVVARSFAATSGDGTVTAVAGGDQMLRSITVEAFEPNVPALTRALDEAIRDSISRAQAETVKAMAEVPGLDPTLAGLLRHGARA